MKSTSQAGIVLVLVMIIIVLASLFWFLYSDYDEVREQAETASSRATRAAAMELEAGQLRAEADQILATRSALETELSTLEQEAVNDQQRIQELETRVAAETTVASIPEIIIASPLNGDVVQLSDTVALTVVAFDPSGLQAINIVFDNNPSLEIPIGGDTRIIIQEPWPLSEAGEHTAVVTAVNAANISSQAATITITVENKRTSEQIRDDVADIIGVSQEQTSSADSTPVTPQTNNISGKSEYNTSLILQTFDFPTSQPSENALDWGVYCLIPPIQATDAPSAVESPAQEIAFVQGQIREWQETQFQVSQRLNAAPNDDIRAAICATVAGHEQWILEEYIRRTPADQQAELLEQLPPLPERFSEDPISAQQSFGKNYGPVFMNTLVAANGPAAIVDVWQNLPQSSYQILFPNEYGASSTLTPIEQSDLTDTLSNDWSLTTTNVFGAFMLGKYLENFVDPALAGTAVSGWQGDQYTIYQQEDTDQTMLTFQLNWASERDAEEFAIIYEQYVNNQNNDEAPFIESPESSKCWQHISGEITCLATIDAQTIIVKAPEEQLALDSLAALIED